MLPSDFQHSFFEIHAMNNTPNIKATVYLSTLFF